MKILRKQITEESKKKITSKVEFFYVLAIWLDLSLLSVMVRSFVWFI